MKYCLIGEKLSHSFSSEIHKKCGLDYSLVEVPKGGLKAFLQGDYDGFNVTIPYKKEIMPFLDVIDENALQIGAVNTVVKKDGKLFGYNTDFSGMLYALKRKGITLKDRNVLILGTGGTSNTAKAVCLTENAKSIVTVSRSGEINYDNCYDLKETEVIINATPVGMYPNIGVSAIDLSRFPNHKGVFDCIYNPSNTALLLQAKALKIPFSDGLPMLVKQAIDAEKIWGYENEEKVDSIINDIYNDKLNVVLVGMPSSGKSTIGKMLSKKIGKKFIDTDVEIENLSGKTPSEIITKNGEKAFRDIETQAIKKVSGENGLVIATGGGAILRNENVDYLKANGIIFYLKRDIELLSAKNRPISQSKGIDELYDERKSYYEKSADFTVYNNKTVDDCVLSIVDIFKNFN